MAAPDNEFLASLERNFIGIRCTMEAQTTVSNSTQCGLFTGEYKKYTVSGVTFSFNGQELEGLKASHKKTKDENKALKISLAALKYPAYSNREGAAESKRRMRAIVGKPRPFRAVFTKNSLEIHGVPQDAYTSTENVVIKVAEALNITVEPEEIEISHKINQGMSILVMFCSHKTKAKIYKERTKLRHVKIADLFPGYPSTA